MCTRILNNIEKDHVTVARNMDWEFNLDGTLFLNPAEGIRKGLSKKEQAKYQLSDSQILTWPIKHKTISTMIGSEGEWGFCDGMNDKGFVANILYDTDCSFNIELTEKGQALSILRWGQYLIDSFATVQDAVNYLEKDDTGRNIRFFPALIPGDSSQQATLHAAISDTSGDSAIIEIKDSKPTIYHDRNHSVMTNEPSYPVQIQLNEYWQYQWGRGLAQNPQPVFTVPGGYSSVQRFERASYYRSLQLELQKEPFEIIDRVGQVAGMIATCKIPQGFTTANSNSGNSENEDQPLNSYTLWTNIARCNSPRYYFVSNINMQTLWLDMPSVLTECYTLTINEKLRASEEMGNIKHLMQQTELRPFSND